MKRVLFALFLLCGSVFADSWTTSNTTDVEDNWLRSDEPDNNFGGSTNIWIYTATTPGRVGLVRVQNLSDSIPAGATIDSAKVVLYCQTVTAGDSVYMYRSLKPWIEGTKAGASIGAGERGSMWYRYWRVGLCDTCWGWGSDGSLCGVASADDNQPAKDRPLTCTSDSADYETTVLDSANVTATGDVTFYIPTSLAQNWYDGTDLENGLVFLGADGANLQFSSSEHATAGQRPEFTFYYTTASGSRRRIAILKGSKIL